MNKILNFHGVSDSIWFEKVILYLKSKYKMVSIQTMYENMSDRTGSNNFCHITADDGEASFYKKIYPVLKKHNVPASIYVSPMISIEKSNFWFQEILGYNQTELKRIIADMSNISLNSILKFNTFSIFKTRTIEQIHEIIKRYCKIYHTSGKIFQNMTVENLKEVELSGLVLIGAHTVNHPILRNEDDSNSKFEIRESITELSNLLNHEIKYFAYPNGIPGLDFSEREMSYLRESGIQLAFSTVSKSISSSDNELSLPRFEISNEESISFLRTKLILNSHWETITRLKRTGQYKERLELVRVFSESANQQ